MESLLTSVHFVVLLSYVCGLYYDVKPPKGSEYESAFWALGGRFKYLTFLDMSRPHDQNESRTFGILSECSITIMMGILAPLMHLLVFAVWAVGVYVDAYIIRPPRDYPGYDFDFLLYGGRLKYLTVLNSLLQCAYFGLSVVNDLIGSETKVRKQQSSIQKFRDWMFTSLVFPMGLFVSLIFWSLYAIDRELIFPASLDSWFPCWLNHVMHTLPAVGVTVELWMACHCYQSGKKRFIPIITAYVMYLTWICYIAYAAGHWVYPIFEVLDMTSRTVFFIAVLFPNLFFVHFGEMLHKMVWGTGKEQTKIKGKKE